MRSTVQTAFVLLTCLAVGGTATGTPAENHYSVAARHYANQNWELAADEFKEFQAKHALHDRADDAAFYAAESLVQLRRFDEAEPRFEQFLLKHPQHAEAPRALFRWGECSYFTGKPIEAIRLLRQFRSENPRDTLNQYALPYLGNLLSESGETEAARETYQQAIAQFPDGSLLDECYLQLAVLAFRDKDYPAVADHLNRLNAEFPEGRLRAESDYWRGMASFEQGQFEQAATDFENVLIANRRHRRAAASQYFAAESWRRQGNPGKARALFEAILEENVHREWMDDARLGLIRIALRQQDYAQLDTHITALESDFADSPRLFEAKQLHGESLVKRNRYQDAIRVLDSMTRADSEAIGQLSRKATAVNLYLLAIAYLGAEQPAKAMEAINRIESPELTPYFQAQIELAKATALSSLDRHGDANRTIRAALERDPPGVLADRIRLTMNRILLKTERFDEAEAAFQQWEDVQTIDSGLRTRAAWQLADYAFDHQMYETASGYYAEMLAADSQTEFRPSGLTGLAWCHFKMGNHADALALFDHLMDGFPDTEAANDVRLARARSLQLLDRNGQAMTAYQEIIDERPSRKAWLAASLAAAQIHESNGELARAGQILEELSRHPDAQVDMDQVLYERGWNLIRLGRMDVATRVFERLHRKHSDSRYWADATFRLADQRFKSGDLDSASQLLDQLAELSATNPDVKLTSYVLHLRGRIAASRRRWSDVLPPMQQLLIEYPTSRLVDSSHFWLGEANYQMEDYAQAKEQLAAIEDRSKTEAWYAMVLLRLAQIGAAERNWPEVQTHIELLDQQFPDFDRAYEAQFLAGRVHAAAGRFQEAREAFQSVVDSPQGSDTETGAMAQWMVGETYLHQKDFQNALRAYLKVEMVYDYPRWRAASLLQAGKCCERLGQVEYAKRLYQRLTTELPASSYHAAARRRLQSINDPDELSPSDPDGSVE